MKHAKVNKDGKRRGIIAALFAIILCLIAVFSTLAYLTVQTKTVDNLMTTGRIDGGIDESTVDINGKAIDSFNDRRDVGQNYLLMPGQKYDKDPIIHIKENSVSTYVYAVVNDMLSTPKCYAENAPTIADQMIANGWKTLDFAPPEGLSGIVWFKEEPVEKSSTVTDVKTFETFSLKPELSQEDILTLDKAIVGVTGLLIQAEGFDSAKHAYRTVYGNTQPEVADDITVTFEYNGGQPTTNTTSQIRVRRGFAFGTGSDRLPVLTRVGYTFDKWYANQECTIPFDLTTKIGHNTILYAGGLKNPAPSVIFDPASPLNSIDVGETKEFTISATAISPVDGSSITIDPSNIEVLYGGTPYVQAQINPTTHNLELTGLVRTFDPQNIYLKIRATDTTAETTAVFVVQKVDSVEETVVSFKTSPLLGGNGTYKTQDMTDWDAVPESLTVPPNSKFVKTSSVLFENSKSNLLMNVDSSNAGEKNNLGDAPDDYVSDMQFEIQYADGTTGATFHLTANYGYYILTAPDNIDPLTSDADLTATFQGLPSTVTFDRQGRGDPPVPATKVVNYGFPYGDLPFLVNEPGMAFDGGFSNSSCTSDSEVTKDTIVSTYEDHRLGAKWSFIDYTITFDNQGGIGGPTSITANYDFNPQNFDIDDLPTKDGYVFKGYFDQPNGLGNKYYNQEGIGFKIYDKTDDCTLFAYGEKEEFDVQFLNSEDGSHIDKVYALNSDGEEEEINPGDVIKVENNSSFKFRFELEYDGREYSSIESVTVGDKEIPVVDGYYTISLINSDCDINVNEVAAVLQAWISESGGAYTFHLSFDNDTDIHYGQAIDRGSYGSDYQIPFMGARDDNDWPWYNSSYIMNISYVDIDESMKNFEGFKTTTYMFESFNENNNHELNLDFSNFNTSNVEDMTYMFYYSSISSVAFGGAFSTVNVQDMEGMFSNVNSIESLDLSSFHTPSLEYFSYMFESCEDLKYINMANFDVLGDALSHSSGVFVDSYGINDIVLGSKCFDDNKSILRGLDGSSFSYGKVYDITNHVEYSNLNDCAGSDFAFNSVTEFFSDELHSDNNIPGLKAFEYMDDQGDKILKFCYDTFNYEHYDEEYDLGGFGQNLPEDYVLDRNGDIPVDVTNLGGSFPGTGYDFKKVIIDPSMKKCYEIKSYKSLFEGCGELVTIEGFENLSTEYVHDMSYMFDYCSAIQSVDLSLLNTSSVVSFEYMFEGCDCLVDVNVSGLDVSSCTRFNNMFEYRDTLSHIYCNPGDDGTKQVDIDTVDSYDMFVACVKLPEYNGDNEINKAKPVNIGGYFTPID